MGKLRFTSTYAFQWFKYLPLLQNNFVNLHAYLTRLWNHTECWRSNQATWLHDYMAWLMQLQFTSICYFQSKGRGKEVCKKVCTNSDCNQLVYHTSQLERRLLEIISGKERCRGCCHRWRTFVTSNNPSVIITPAKWVNIWRMHCKVYSQCHSFVCCGKA